MAGSKPRSNRAFSSAKYCDRHHVATGLDQALITDLALKALHGSIGMSGGEIARRLGLTFAVVEPSLEFLKAQVQGVLGAFGRGARVEGDDARIATGSVGRAHRIAQRALLADLGEQAAAG